MKKVLGLLLCFLLSCFGEICDRPLVLEFETAGSVTRLNDDDIDGLKAHGITVLAMPTYESGEQPADGFLHFANDKSVANPTTDHHPLQIDASEHELGATRDKSSSGNGQLVFRFDNPMTVQKVGLADVDTNGAAIKVTMRDGGTMSLNVPPTHSTVSNQLVDIHMDKVEELTVLFPPGRGAVRSLNLCVPVPTTTQEQRRRKALVVNPRPTPAPTQMPSSLPSTSCDPMFFQGLSRGYSFEKGSIHLEWDPATQLLSNQTSTSLPCSNVSYHVFFASEKFDYSNQTVADLLGNVDIVHVRTNDLELNKKNLLPNATYAVLVIASSSGDKVFSGNRDFIRVKTSSVDPKMGNNVSFVGTFAPSNTIRINFDKKSRLFFNSTTGLPKGIRKLAKGKHLAVITSGGSHHLFIIKSIVATNSTTNAQFVVAKQILADLFEELELDISADAGELYQQAVIFQKPGRRKLTSFGIDRTVTIDETANIGPLKVRGRISLRAYVRATVRIGFFSVKEASLAAGGSESTLASIQYTRALTHTSSFRQRVFTGPTATFGTFWVGPVPIWIDFQPVLDVAGSVSVSLEAAFQVTVTQEASIDAFAGYKDGWKSYVDTHSSKSISTNVQGKARLTAEAGVILTLRIELDGIIGVGIGVSGGLNCQAEAVLVNNPVLLQPPSIQPVQLTKFDVNAFFRVPISLTSIFGDHDFGNLYEVTVPLLTLPKFDIQKVSVATCDTRNAIVLKAKVTPRPYNLLIDNRITGLHQWWDDFNPQNSLSENADPNAQYYKMEGERTLQVTLKLGLLNGQVGSTAYWLGTTPFDIPAGKLCFRTTPLIPLLPYSLVSCVDINTLFGSQSFECCSSLDCSARYSLKKSCSNTRHTCFQPTPTLPLPTFIAPLAPGRLTTVFPRTKATPRPTASPIVGPRRTEAISDNTDSVLHAKTDVTKSSPTGAPARQL